MKAIILNAARGGGKVARIEIEEAHELKRLDDVEESLAMSSERMEVRVYFQARFLADIVDALEAAGAEVAVRQQESY